MMNILRGEGIVFSEVFIDRSLPSDNAPTRKPGTAMLTKYLSSGVDMDASWVIGDRETDIQFAGNLGCKSIFISEGLPGNATVSVKDWNEIYSILSKLPRTASISRKTSETSIDVKINLDGNGKSNIKTGIGFFDHMLEQIPRHGLFDVEIIVSGDLHVDEHHTIEDVGLALGSAFNEALGMKKGIQRYAFVLPMDECLAQVAVDLGGRPWLDWNTTFSREKIGEMPTEMFRHFFRSFSDNAKCTLNISASGENEHHRIESIFKAFSKCMGQAAGKTGNFSIPSSKGTL
jgi:imidazoleglycerol-phosphate dehydratase/histidinol-phosphatase